MTDNNKTTTRRHRSKGQPAIIVNDFTRVAADRNRKDIGTLKRALIQAESVQLPNRVALYDLYTDILSLDGTLSGLVDKRIKAVTNKELHFYDADGHIVREMDALIASARFQQLCTILMNTLFWGCSGVEFIVGEKLDFVEVPRKHIRPEKGHVVTSQFQSTGYPLDELPHVWVTGGKYDLGKLLQCSMYAIYKRSGMGDFAQYVEIFGQPVRIIYYDSYDTRTRDELRKILQEAGSSLSMMVPKQAKFEMMDGKQSNGTGELQSRLIEACDREMAIAILGTTETTSASSGSGYAQAKEHGRQQLEITKDDIKYLQNLLNEDRFLEILRQYGYPVEGGSFRFTREINLEELRQRLEIDMQVSRKVPVSDDYWYETYGIPRPDNHEAVKKGEQRQEDPVRQGNGKGRQENERRKLQALFSALSGFFASAPTGGGAKKRNRHHLEF